MAESKKKATSSQKKQISKEKVSPKEAKEFTEDFDDPNVIKTLPTKDLFISMLIRDITLKDAIGDLVDNCVDGARSISTKKDYTNLSVDIKISPSQFSISDTCGGFSAEIARKYAFRFGRPQEFKALKGSIGQFGIGMKRAIFKIGSHVVIESTSLASTFKVTIDVDKWRSDPAWAFHFDYLKEGITNDISKCGTKITVSNLTIEASEQFKDKVFVSDLIEEIGNENIYNINRGLKISINTHPLKGMDLTLLHSKDIQPAYQKIKYKDVDVQLSCGIGTAELKRGGWYIFCNDRMVLGPEQTQITGWSGKGKDGVAEYHDQFKMFRGYAFFNSDNSGSLPWNTTKNNVDLDSPLFISTRLTMIEMMKPVITFLNKLKKEKENQNPEENQPLGNIVKSLKITNLESVKSTDFKPIFTFPNLAPQKIQVDADETKITFSMDRRKVEKVKKFLKAKTNTEVGEKVFNYFYDNEI